MPGLCQKFDSPPRQPIDDQNRPARPSQASDIQQYSFRTNAESLHQHDKEMPALRTAIDILTIRRLNSLTA